MRNRSADLIDPKDENRVFVAALAILMDQMKNVAFTEL
jgi:hypothetical protein